MAKFKRGDKVRVSEGMYTGKTGVVIDPCVQISQSDWPYVLLLADDGHNASADEDSLELAEDPYEYGVQLSSAHGPGRVREDDWMSLGDAQNELEAFEGDDGHDLLSYKLVKRRKAGPVEDA